VFRAGHAKVGGRKKGEPNKASRAWKDFVTTLCDDLEVQEAAKKAIVEGRADLLFRAAEHAHGKPHQSMDISMADRKMINWPERVATEDDFAK
jgi:hypothetical protein